MNPSELKAVLATTKEVAAYPSHIEATLPYWANSRDKRGRHICPIGLKRAVVIEDNHKWVEHRQIAQCGDQDYAIQRRNGVLVEFDFDDLAAKMNHDFEIKGSKIVRDGHKYAHTEVIERDGGKVIRMVISRKVIVAAWGEYALIEAAREKQHEEADRRDYALRHPQARIMGFTDEEFAKLHINNTDERTIYLNAEHKQFYKKTDKTKSGDWDYVYENIKTPDGWTSRERVLDYEVGIVQITTGRIEEILNVLTPAQMKKLGIPKS